MTHDLVDEYRLLVYPVVLGRGRRPFEDGISTTLERVQATPLDSGVVHLS